MYKGKSKRFDSVLMVREGNICTVQLTNEILSYGGRYIFQLRGYTDTQTYHSDIFESWVNASIEYQDDCKQIDCGCDCKLPTEFYQVEDNAKIKNKTVKEVQHWINTYPRRILGGETPLKAFKREFDLTNSTIQ